MSLQGDTQLGSRMAEEHHPGQMQPNQLGQREIRTSGPLTPVDINAGVGQSVTEANLGIPTIGAIPTGTHEYEAPSPDFDFFADGDGNGGNTTHYSSSQGFSWSLAEQIGIGEMKLMRPDTLMKRSVGLPQWTGMRRVFQQILKNLLVS